MINNLPESQVIKIWQRLLRYRTELTTEGGEPIKIIYPGRINDDRGADFRDAVITTSQGLIKGDIEVHVKSSGWQSHQHHHDPAYNRVILHVVMWHDSKATILENGKGAPILVLDKYIKSPISQRFHRVYNPTNSGMPGFKNIEHVSTDKMAEFLDSAGTERFLFKATKFQANLAQLEASQCLYQGIMGALGYSKNKLPFLELARRLPLQILESVTQGEISDEECLARQQALLLGTAGLLPSQRSHWHQKGELDGEWIDKLARLWASSYHTGAMSYNDWHLFKVRPSNFPVRRLVAMSYIIVRYRQQGIFDGVVNTVKEAALSQNPYILEKGLVVTASGYWSSHFDFSSGSRIKSPTLLGSSRAADIAVNVLLPFMVAWSRLTCRPEIERKVFDLYHRYPKLVVNSIVRHMTGQLGLSSSLVNSAQRQQGLIHIYNTLCTQGRCNCCPLTQSEAGNHIQV
ncbi:MAG TPA: DUF2851 family protein [Dehalococcoidia bacterium]|nr:DUF2851 family protein [Dehalococcoidia bacterium]